MRNARICKGSNCVKSILFPWQKASNPIGSLGQILSILGQISIMGFEIRIDNRKSRKLIPFVKMAKILLDVSFPLKSKGSMPSVVLRKPQASKYQMIYWRFSRERNEITDYIGFISPFECSATTASEVSGYESLFYW